jgi:hypothetical protein
MSFNWSNVSADVAYPTPELIFYLIILLPIGIFLVMELMPCCNYIKECRKNYACPALLLAQYDEKRETEGPTEQDKKHQRCGLD